MTGRFYAGLSRLCQDESCNFLIKSAGSLRKKDVKHNAERKSAEPALPLKTILLVKNIKYQKVMGKIL